MLLGLFYRHLGPADRDVGEASTLLRHVGKRGTRAHGVCDLVVELRFSNIVVTRDTGVTASGLLFGQVCDGFMVPPHDLRLLWVQ